MRTRRLDEFVRGWVVGDFTPSIHRNQHVEVAVTTHLAGEPTFPHLHKESTEINIVVRGSLEANGSQLGPKDIFIYERGETCFVDFIEDTTLVVIRFPAAPNDKEFLEPQAS